MASVPGGEVQSAGYVLVVDGGAANRGLISNVLRQAGYETREAPTGEDALTSAREELPRLVVTEVNLPGISGYEVCRELREQFGDDLPIVFVSGERTESYDRVAGLIVGADDYVAMPFAPDELLARVRRLVRRAPQSPPYRLTQREREVLALLSEGLRQAGIARRLSISEKTVAKHIEHILAKLGVHSRAEAIVVAYREPLVRA